MATKPKRIDFVALRTNAFVERVGIQHLHDTGGGGGGLRHWGLPHSSCHWLEV